MQCPTGPKALSLLFQLREILLTLLEHMHSFSSLIMRSVHSGTNAILEDWLLESHRRVSSSLSMLYTGWNERLLAFLFEVDSCSLPLRLLNNRLHLLNLVLRVLPLSLLTAVDTSG